MSQFQSRKFPKSKAKIQSRGFAKRPAKSKKPVGSSLPDCPMTEKARQVRIEALKKELKALDESEPPRFIGTSTWIVSDEENTDCIDEIIVIAKSGGLDIEFSSDGYTYDAKLIHQKDNYYEGRWTCYENNVATDSGNANAVLYHAGAKHLVLGDWWQDDKKYCWWANVDNIKE